MICPHCAALSVAGKKFCGDCGSPLPWLCDVCGEENPADKRFCGDCGAPQGNAAEFTPLDPTARAAERRMLNVMFIDLVGSTAIGLRLDPEDLRQVITAFQRVVTSIVNRFNGFI